MDTESSTTMQDKQITVDVPADRVAEFYAWYGRFLARAGSRGGHGPRGRRHGHRHGHGCGRPSEAAEAAQAESDTTNV